MDGNMVLSENEHKPIGEIQNPLEHSVQGAYGAGWPVRIAVLLGFLIVLVIEGWLLAKLLF